MIESSVGSSPKLLGAPRSAYLPNDWTISVLDDDASLRDALKGLLRSAGLRAEVFASAEEFLNSGRLRATRCLILDVRMPGMSGMELQEWLIASDSVVPIVFISAHGDDDARALALERGAVDFLTKPFSDDALLSAVMKAAALT